MKIGIYNPNLASMGGGERLSLSVASVLADNPSNEVCLISHGQADLDAISEYFHLDLSAVKLVCIEAKSLAYAFSLKLRLPERISSWARDRRVFRELASLKMDAFVNAAYRSNLPNPSHFGVYLCMFPQKLKFGMRESPFRWLYYGVINALYRETIDRGNRYPHSTYHSIVSISEFTRGYVRAYWERDSQVLHPPCDDMLEDPPPQKKNKIVAVGRFFESGNRDNAKRHDILIECFSAMEDLHKSGWELHLVGSRAKDDATSRYVNRLVDASADLPVYFHFDCSFRALQRLFNEASIFWHAAGFGSDPLIDPERQEHFGITTVEAMSAKCIPVVIDSPSQREIVTPSAGILWSTPGELKSRTMDLVRMKESQVDRLRTLSRERSRTFNFSSFRSNVESIFAAECLK